MKTLRAQELKQQLEQNDDLLLVNVLGPEDFQKEHIPGSRNIPESRDDFVEQVETLAETKQQPIVVYCASKDCKSSPSAARKLTEAGFKNVADFEGGMAEWKLNNYEIEGSEVPATSTR